MFAFSSPAYQKVCGNQEGSEGSLESRRVTRDSMRIFGVAFSEPLERSCSEVSFFWSSGEYPSSKSVWSIGELLGFEAAVPQLIFRDFRLKKLLNKVGETSVLLPS